MKDCVEEKSAVKQVNREVSKQTKTSNNKRNERRCENYIIDSVIGCFFLQHSIILRETGLVVYLVILLLDGRNLRVGRCGVFGRFFNGGF